MVFVIEGFAANRIISAGDISLCFSVYLAILTGTHAMTIAGQSPAESAKPTTSYAHGALLCFLSVNCHFLLIGIVTATNEHWADKK